MRVFPHFFHFFQFFQCRVDSSCSSLHHSLQLDFINQCCGLDGLGYLQVGALFEMPGQIAAPLCATVLDNKDFGLGTRGVTM
jgi:hypothetical protein